ncbi:hypothetical protein LAPL110952_11155 [Lactiplantibacillus plajomi]
MTAVVARRPPTAKEGIPMKTPGHKNKLSYFLIAGGALLLLLIILIINRPSLRERLVAKNWYLFDDTTVTLKMNDTTATAKDRLFSSDGGRTRHAQAHVIFYHNGTGKIVQSKRVTAFKWTLTKNVVTLKPAHQSTIHWTLARTSGKVAGQHFKGYTVASDDHSGHLFVGTGFLLYKRWF